MNTDNQQHAGSEEREIEEAIRLELQSHCFNNYPQAFKTAAKWMYQKMSMQLTQLEERLKEAESRSVCRWVKASERLPEDQMNTMAVEWENNAGSRCGGYFDREFLEQKLRDRLCRNLKWLEEIPAEQYNDQIAALQEEIKELKGQLDASRYVTDQTTTQYFEACRERDAAKSKSAGFSISETDCQVLLEASLKPGEIGADATTQFARMEELMRWFVRFASGDANPKWLRGHAFELAYYIATNAANRFIDLDAIKEKSFIEGVNIKPNERALLEKLGAIQPPKPTQQ